ncbi:MAG: hypothetical protein PHC70_01130 [Patescibacteria group bacterium]|jgi:hypothetical protein|nr:hypothetical protein [Patescibacteria group bacterium]
MRKNLFNFSVAAGVLALLSLYGLGCNPFQKAQETISNKIGENVAEGLLGKATGGKVDIKDGGNTVTYKDNENGGTTSFGEDIKLPDDFPKSVPIYPGAKIGGVTVSRQGNPSAWVVFSSADEVKKVTDWYEQQTKDKGWKQDSSMTIDKAEIRTYVKDNEKIGISVSPSDDESKGKSSVMLTWDQELPSADSAQ